MITLGSITITERTKALMKEALEKGQVGQTERIKEFESGMAKFLGVGHAVAVSNGTMADIISLAVLKHFFPGKDEVIVPALTFIAHPNSVYFNRLKPIFVDVGHGMQIDLAATEKAITEKTLAIMPVHLLGKPAEMGGLRRISQTHNIPIVEDACEALGSKYRIPGEEFKLCGTFGAMGCFSFYPSHTITTGEGGMIVTDNDDYAAMARVLRNHGKKYGDQFIFDVIGFNAKMNAMEAIVGLGLLPELQEAINKRNAHYLALGGAQEVDEFICPHGLPRLYTDKKTRDEKMVELKKGGIESRTLFSAIPTQEKAYAFLGYQEGDFPVAEDFGNRGLYVPSHQDLIAAEIETIKVHL